MTARDVLRMSADELALRLLSSRERLTTEEAARLLAEVKSVHRAEVIAEGIPPLYVADYDSAPLTLHLTREAARAACDDVAKVDACGRCWDWRAEEDGVDRQVWTHPDDDRPVSYTGGAVWEITVEQGTAGKGTPAGGELTRARNAAVAYLRDANGDMPLSLTWRVVDTDTERATGIGLVCTATGDADEHVVLDGIGRDESGVYGCCPYPVIETWSAELAQYFVTLLNNVPSLLGTLAETAEIAGFNRRSVEHIAAKRDLAEAAIAEWERGAISADAALLMVRKALAVGPVKTAAEAREGGDRR